MALLVTGSIGVDTIALPGGETREGLLGGSCTYFSAAARLLAPPPVRLVAAVGEDFPGGLRAELESLEGVSLAGLETRAGRKTFRWGGRYLEDMDHRETTFTELGVLAEEPPAIPAEFRDASFMFLANGAPPVQAGLLDQVQPAGGAGPRLVVADTMDLWIDTAKPELAALLARIDGVALNFDEAEQFTGTRNPVTAGRHMLDEIGGRLRFVCIKKGEHGALLVHRDGIAALPAYPAEEVVDPTGAGDSFAGGLMAWLAATADAAPEGFDPGGLDWIRRAMAWGTVTASFTIETFGLDRLRTLTRDELDDRFARYAEMTRIG